MPRFRATVKRVIPSRSKRFARFLEEFITPTPSRTKANNLLFEFANPTVRRKGLIGSLNAFINPRARRFGFWKTLNQFLVPEARRTGFLGAINAFIDNPVYRLQQGGDIIRPRQRNATLLQRLISAINEFVTPYTHFSDLIGRDIVIETPSDAFKAALEKLVFTSRIRIDRLVGLLERGAITPRQFQARMIAEIRRVNLASAMLGASGLGNLTPDILGAVDDRITSEIARLNAFLENSFGPNLTRGLGTAPITPPQFRAYALKFASAGRAIANVAQNAVLTDLYGAGISVGGRMFVRRVSLSDDRSCGDCLAYTQAGWVDTTSAEAPPPPTQDCECAENCRCYMEHALANSPDDLPDDIAY